MTVIVHLQIILQKNKLSYINDELKETTRYFS